MEVVAGGSTGRLPGLAWGVGTSVASRMMDGKCGLRRFGGRGGHTYILLRVALQSKPVP